MYIIFLQRTSLQNSDQVNYIMLFVCAGKMLEGRREIRSIFIEISRHFLIFYSYCCVIERVFCLINFSRMFQNEHGAIDIASLEIRLRIIPVWEVPSTSGQGETLARAGTATTASTPLTSWPSCSLFSGNKKCYKEWLRCSRLTVIADGRTYRESNPEI